MSQRGATCVLGRFGTGADFRAGSLVPGGVRGDGDRGITHGRVASKPPLHHRLLCGTKPKVRNNGVRVRADRQHNEHSRQRAMEYVPGVRVDTATPTDKGSRQRRPQFMTEPDRKQKVTPR
jgi:hypothetical protein